VEEAALLLADGLAFSEEGSLSGLVRRLSTIAG
jgi:hypothetical protein